jgi:hypothetical protein
MTHFETGHPAESNVMFTGKILSRPSSGVAIKRDEGDLDWTRDLFDT